jgi:hypothetical protein
VLLCPAGALPRPAMLLLLRAELPIVVELS